VVAAMPLGLDSHFYLYALPLIVIESLFLCYAFPLDARSCQVILGLVGLWWCCAALWVEVKIAQVYPGFEHDNPPDPEMKAYRPFCDFAPWANCSQVLMSPSGRFLRQFGIALAPTADGKFATIRRFIDVPNPTLGVMFFSCHLFYNVLVNIVDLLGDYVPAVLFTFMVRALPWAFFVACCGVCCMTVWLAYNLFFVLKDFCVVCVSMYVVIAGCAPTMYHACKLDSDLMRGFGVVPQAILYPFLLLDAIMFVSVLVLYCSGDGSAHAREQQASSDYKPLADAVA